MSNWRRRITRAMSLRGLLLLIGFLGPLQAAPAFAQDSAEMNAVTEAVSFESFAANPDEANQDEADVDDSLFERMRSSAPVQALANAMNPEIALILDVAAAWYQNQPDSSGAHDPNRNGFNFQQLELSLGSSVDPYFRMDANIVFSNVGVEVEEAYASTLALDASTIRVGKMLSQFGRVNSTHPHTWAFADQMWAIGRNFGAEGHSALGVDISYLLPLPWFADVSIGVFDGRSIVNSRSFATTDGPVRSIRDFVGVATAKQSFGIGSRGTVLWGLSGALGGNRTGYHNASLVAGTDLYMVLAPNSLGHHKFEWQTEALMRRRQLPTVLAVNYDLYSFVRYWWSAHYAVAARVEWASPLRDGGRIIVDDLDPRIRANRFRYSGNLSWWPTEFSRLRLQVNLEQTPKTNLGAILSAEFNIGAHGSHAF